MAARPTNPGTLVVHGINAVRALLETGHPTERILVRAGTPPQPLRALLSRASVPVATVSVGELDRLSAGGHHQGVVAMAAPLPESSIEDVAAAPGRGAVLLDGVVDPRNLGAIVRSARAAGARGLVLPRDRSAPLRAVAIAASAGTVFGMPVARVSNLVRAMGTLREAGFWLVGLAAEGERRLEDLPRFDDPALVVGGEGEGLRRLVRERCDVLAGIPMAAGVESLNAAVAAGIALYELLVRQVGDAV